MRMPSWFDLDDIPVTDGIAHPGMEESVDRIHGLVKKCEDEGIPSKKIVIGGFSQGGCLSLHAGLSTPQEIGGVCCLSGWRSESKCKPMAQKNTPVMIGHGDSDQVVPFECGKTASEALTKDGFSDVRFKPYRGVQHGSCP